jgi:hypothetical protein
MRFLMFHFRIVGSKPNNQTFYKHPYSHLHIWIWVRIKENKVFQSWEGLTFLLKPLMNIWACVCVCVLKTKPPQGIDQNFSLASQF